MKAAVIVFPGSNCDRDVAVSLKDAMGTAADMIWHGDAEIPKTDLIVLPGGFSYGDYLRCGAMAAQSPIMKDVVAKANSGVPVLGICNGFQLLTEAGLLPGAMLRNANLKYICKDVHLRIERNDTVFSRHYTPGDIIKIPIAHHDGNFFADTETLTQLEDQNLIAFRYCDSEGKITEAANPNGSANNIAGIYNDKGTILGLMPHPERLADMQLGGADGKAMFSSLVETLH